MRKSVISGSIDLDKYLRSESLTKEEATAVFNYLKTLDGLLTSYSAERDSFQIRYTHYDRDQNKVKVLVSRFVYFIANLFKAIKTIDPDSSLNYIESQTCINLRISINISKDKLYSLLEEQYQIHFRSDDRFLSKQDSDAFRVLRKKADHYKNPNSVPTIMVVIGLVNETLDAFVKEQEIAEDLYLFKQNSDQYHFKNSRSLFNHLNLDYQDNKIHLLQERNRRVDMTCPLTFGHYNFKTDDFSSCGSILADIAVYNDFNGPTYLSVKSFGRNHSDRVHLISLKFDWDEILSKTDHLVISYLYRMVVNQIDRIATLYEANSEDIEGICSYIIENYDYSELTSQLDYEFDCISFDQKLNSIKKVFNCCFLRNWNINPFRYFHTFMSYQNNIQTPSDASSTRIDISNQSVLNNFQKFIVDAWGKGYVLIAAKNRYLYYSDYRECTLSQSDSKILNCTIQYPVATRNAIEIQLKTETMYFVGEIYPSRSIWPNTVSFFYRYNDIERSMIKTAEENEIFNEGYLINGGFRRGRLK